MQTIDSEQTTNRLRRKSSVARLQSRPAILLLALCLVFCCAPACKSKTDAQRAAEERAQIKKKLKESTALLPYVLQLSQPDWQSSAKLRRGINTAAGALIHPALKESLA